MSTEIQKVDNALITEYVKAFVTSKLADTEVSQFVGIAQAFQLNPFKREIHVVKYGNQMSLITGYEVYLKRAERSNKLNGWSVEITGDTATITIHRKDWQQPFKHSVKKSEYIRTTAIWKEKPETMLRKVVIAQGFRLAFPDECGGLPYTEEEHQTITVEATAEPIETIPQEQYDTIYNDVRIIDNLDDLVAYFNELPKFKDSPEVKKLFSERKKELKTK